MALAFSEEISASGKTLKVPKVRARVAARRAPETPMGRQAGPQVQVEETSGSEPPSADEDERATAATEVIAEIMTYLPAMGAGRGAGAIWRMLPDGSYEVRRLSDSSSCMGPSQTMAPKPLE